MSNSDACEEVKNDYNKKVKNKDLVDIKLYTGENIISATENEVYEGVNKMRVAIAANKATPFNFNDMK